MSEEIIAQLIEAVQQGMLPKSIQLIEQHNIDVSKIFYGNFKHTLLFYAALIPDSQKCYDMTAMLISKGVQTNYLDILGQSVLFYLAREGKIKILDLLTTNGCNPDIPDQYGQTPLYYAAREGHIEVVDRLLRIGANPNNKDNMGQTALFYSAREGHAKICELLLNYGCDVNLKDNKKGTPLKLAIRGNKIEVIDLLLSRGAKQPRDERERSKKKSGTKKQTFDHKKVRHYKLIGMDAEGIWRELERKEIEEFKNKNPEINKLLEHPETLPPPPEVLEEGILYDHWDKAGKQILSILWRKSGARIFHEPVDPIALNIPDYYTLISSPMDFGTIRNKLETCKYWKPSEFISDIEQVFKNCIKYNGESSDYGALSYKMWNDFHQLLKTYNIKYYSE